MKGEKKLIKSLKNLLMFASIVVMYQLNPCNVVLASDISNTTQPKTQAVLTQDISKSKTLQDTSKILASQDESKYISQSNSNSQASESSGNLLPANADNVDNVPVDKSWIIHFNQPIDLSSAKENVKIINKKTNAEVPINISLSNYDSYMTVSTVSAYDPESYYILKIDNNLMGRYNKVLKTALTMNFKTGAKIENIDDISVSINQGDSYKLPDEVTAVMSDGEKKQVGIEWNKKVNTLASPGNYVYQGQVKGYSKEVDLSVTINPSTKNVDSIASTSMWIWELQNQVDAYGGIDNLIAKLKSMGINNVCIKYNEGSRPSGGGTNFRDDFLKYVGYFKEAGFKVGTWGYNHFDDVQGEGNLIIEALNNSDYYVFDAEDAVQKKAEQTEEICELIRSQCPNAIIGYTSFPIASLHQDIAYSVFNKYCDFSAPQCYWGEMQWSVNRCLDQMAADYKAYGLDKPLYPIIQTYSINYEDYAAYSKYGFKSTGLWSLDDIGQTFVQFVNDMGSKFSN